MKFGEEYRIVALPMARIKERIKGKFYFCPGIIFFIYIGNLFLVRTTEVIFSVNVKCPLTAMVPNPTGNFCIFHFSACLGYLHGHRHSIICSSSIVINTPF